MDDGDVRVRAADLLLKRGLRVRIARASFFMRILGLHRIRIRPLYGGAIMRISRLLDAEGVEPFATPRETHVRMDVVAKAVALAVLNVWWKIWLYRPFARLLLWVIPGHILIQIYNEVRRVDDVTDFINITISMSLKGAMMMLPKIQERGQKKSGG